MVKRFFIIVLFFCLATISFAQSTNYIIHAIPLGKVDSEIYTEDWADTFLTTNNEWILSYEGIWVTISEDGKTISISEDRPNFVDASYIIPSEEFIAREESLWNLPGELQTKKFKYDYKECDSLLYLVISVKLERNQERHF